MEKNVNQEAKKTRAANFTSGRINETRAASFHGQRKIKTRAVDLFQPKEEKKGIARHTATFVAMLGFHQPHEF